MDPTIPSLSGTASPVVLRRYFLATRPAFMAASVLPVILGTSWGAHTVGALDWLAFALAIFAVMLVHGAVNVLNDVYDDELGTDRLNEQHVFPYTGGSRFIQNDILSATQMRRWGIIQLAIATVVGLLLFLYKGPLVLLFGMAGILTGVLYSMPPVQLSARGIGEIAVGLGFGVLPVTGAAWLQSGHFDPGAFILSVPASIWVANILLVNGIPDATADAATGKRTLVVRLGIAGSAMVYGATSIAAFLFICLAVLKPGLSIWTLLVPAGLLVLGLRVSLGLKQTKDPATVRPFIEKTLAIHAVGILWLSAWVWSA